MKSAGHTPRVLQRPVPRPRLLDPSDRIEVENRAGKLFEYRVVESTIVDPDETWVIGPDPLGTTNGC